MNSERENMELPLSWVQNRNWEVKIITAFGCEWISFAQVYDAVKFEKLIDEKIALNKSVVIRGVKPSDLNGILMKKGFKFYPIGSEAVIPTDKDLFRKKSLKELVRRGLKHGRVKRFEHKDIDWVKFTDLWLNGVHYEEPKLKNLYRLEVDENCMLFTLSSGGHYFAAISISINSRNKYQAELLLRRKGAPVGVMEALVYSIKEFLNIKGAAFFSLGEVPFVIKERDLHRFIPLAINALGRSLKFAYNYHGLYNFKNKFNPVWQDVYLAAYPQLKPGMLFNILINSNLYRLVLYKMFN